MNVADCEGQRRGGVSGHAAASDSLCGKASPACYNRRAAFRIHRASRHVAAEPTRRAGPHAAFAPG